MMAGKRRRKLFPEYKDQEVQLITITRVVREDGIIEYISKKKEGVPISKLPADAVHVTGNKKAFSFIDMKPDYPDYYADCDGFDAIGYYLLYNDRRMNEAYEGIADFGKKTNIEKWKKYLIIGAAGIIFAAVLLKFIM